MILVPFLRISFIDNCFFFHFFYFSTNLYKYFLLTFFLSELTLSYFLLFLYFTTKSAKSRVSSSFCCYLVFVGDFLIFSFNSSKKKFFYEDIKVRIFLLKNGLRDSPLSKSISSNFYSEAFVIYYKLLNCIFVG